MYLTEKEIMTQHEALAKTFAYLKEETPKLKNFFEKHPSRRFVFLGCGSSYMIAKSAQRLFAAAPLTAATAIAGGDYLVNPDYYAETIKDSIIVTLSRSGKTSEIVRDVKQIKETYGNPVLSISMCDDNDIMPYADYNLTMDWCYDKSVCQTRTVTNLYAALLILSAVYCDDSALVNSVDSAVKQNEVYKKELRPVLADLAKKDWDNAIILTDGAPVGIGEEGALAFTEIAMLSGKCFNLLDYRHGPMVLNDKKTLTIAMLQPNEDLLQSAMVHDLRKRGGTLVTISAKSENQYEADVHITIQDIDRFEAWGIPFIFVMQMIAYEKSILLGRNPDAPIGLDAYITLP